MKEQLGHVVSDLLLVWLVVQGFSVQSTIAITMTLSRQIVIVGLVVFLFLMVAVCYLRLGDIRHLVVDTSSNRNHGLGSSKIRLSTILNKSLKGHGEEYANPFVNVTKIQSALMKVSSFEQKTSPTSRAQNSSTGTGNLEASSVISGLKGDITDDNDTSQKSVLPNKSVPGDEQSVAFTTPSYRTSEKTCSPLTNIAFFKMHKCSSSTVQNILFRYGEEHKLNFVLPPSGNYLGHSAFNKRYMIKFPVKEYNILCSHTVFSASGMEEVMPINSMYVTILRDPVPMFESLFSYNHMAHAYHLPESHGLELFFEKPEYYYRIKDGGILHVKNPMLYGLGLPRAVLGDHSAIDEKIEQLKDQFDLVMMTEYFEESLILLWELMCWELDDIVYFVLNARSKSSVKKISQDVTNKIKKWNYGDVKLYDSFNRTFWKKVEAFGQKRMKEEVTKLKERNQYYKQRCVAGVINNNPRVWHPPGVPIDSFQLKPEALKDKMCSRMAEPELHYTEHLRQIQKARYGMR